MPTAPAYYRIDEYVKTAQGPAVANAQVFYCSQPASVTAFPPSPQVQLYADPLGVNPISQPLIADGFGHVSAYIAPGTYTMVVAYNGVIQRYYSDQEFGISSIPFPVSGNSPFVATALATLTSAASGLVVITDGSGNVQPGGTLLAALVTTAALAVAIAPLAPMANPVFSGNVSAPSIEYVLYADQFAGADLGAKINAAFASSSANTEVLINQNAGTTWSTAVTVPIYCGIRFIQGGTYTISAQIKMSSSSWIAGLPASVNEAINFGLLNPTVVLHQGISANLNPVILVAGQNVVLKDFCLDGNSAANTGNSVGVATDTSIATANSRGRLRMRYVTVQNFNMDNVQLLSTSTNNQAEAAHFDFCAFSASILGCGLRVINTTDWRFTDSQNEVNGGWGIFSYASTGMILASDISTATIGLVCFMGQGGTAANLNGGQNFLIGNSLSGPAATSGLSAGRTKAAVTAVSVSSGVATLTCTQTYQKGDIALLWGFTDAGNLGLNGTTPTVTSAGGTSFTIYAPTGVTGGTGEAAAYSIAPGSAGLFIDGYDHINSVATVNNNVISANLFGFEGGSETGTFDAIHIQDSGSNIITGTQIASGPPLNTYRYGIYIASVLGTEYPDSVINNVLYGTYGTGFETVLSNTWWQGNSLEGAGNPAAFAGGNNGLAPQFNVNLTAQAASVGSTTLLSTQYAGLYKIIWDAVCTKVGTSANTVTVNFAWNNAAGITSFTSATLSLTTLGNELSGVLPVTLASGAAVLAYSTTLNNTTGTPNYSLTLRVEPL